MLAAAVLMGLQQIGIDVSLITTTVLIVLSALVAGTALAFGLGAQSFVAQILAMHYVQKSFRIGERLRIEGIEGRIIRFTATAVILDTEAGEASVPALDLMALAVSAGEAAITAHPAWERVHALPVVDGRRFVGVLRYKVMRRLERGLAVRTPDEQAATTRAALAELFGLSVAGLTAATMRRDHRLPWARATKKQCSGAAVHST
jgi:RNase P/RNase MRP subunit p29